MNAFDPTPLRPDAPAFPMHSHEADNWNNPVPYVEGLTARQHAAIALCVPDSGVDWLDAMIEQRRRDEFAKSALTGMLSCYRDPIKNTTDERCQLDTGATSRKAYTFADAMLAASKR